MDDPQDDNNAQADKRPWYREPLVWMIIAIPMSAVVMAAIMIPLAVSTDDGLVTDDYYKRGLQINRVLARDEQAAALGLDIASLAIGRAGVTLQLAAPEPDRLPARLDMTLAHATRPDLDQAFGLIHQGGGLYAGEVEPLAPGAWNVAIGTDEWRLTARHVVSD